MQADTIGDRLHRSVEKNASSQSAGIESSTDKRVHDAAASIALFESAALQKAIEKYDALGREQDRRVIPHSALESVPVRAFAHYAVAMEKISIAARQLLVSDDPAEALLKTLEKDREERLYRYGHSGGQAPKHALELTSFANDYGAALKYADLQLLDAMRGIAEGSRPLETEIRSYDMAIMALRVQVDNTRVVDQLNERRTVVQAHGKLMEEALEFARTGNWTSAYPQARTESEAAFLKFCDLKLEAQGFIPKAHFVHDLDGNLVPIEDSHLKPGNIIGKIANEVDLLAPKPLPGWQRMSLADNLSRINGCGRLAEQMFNYAGEHTHIAFKDAVDALNSAEAAQIDSVILTANMADYAKGVALRTDMPDRIRIIGKDVDTFRSEQKPARLAEIFLDDPSGVFLMSDDRDSALCNAISQNRLFENLNYDFPAEHLCFFAARGQGDGESAPHKFAQILTSCGVPFALNHKASNGDGFDGYQGTKRLTDLYGEWRNQKLQEGWPTTQLGVQAQRQALEIVGGLSATREALIERLEAKAREMDEHLRGNGHDYKMFLARADLQVQATFAQSGGNGINIAAMTRMADAFEQQTAGIPESSPRRAVIAARVFRDFLEQEASAIQAARNETLPEGTVRTLTVAKERLAIINGGATPVEKLDELLTRGDAQHAMNNSEAAFLLVRLTNGRGSDGRIEEKTVVIPRTDAAREKLTTQAEPFDRVKSCSQDAYLIPRDEGSRTHRAQFEDFVRLLNGSVTVAEIYYRNGFAPAGGLEKTIRKQAEVLADWGFKVRIIGGNEPDRENYDDGLLKRFEHRVIEGAHERDHESLEIAGELYSNKHPDFVPTNYFQHYAKLTRQMRDALEGVDVAIVHNPLFLRNVPLTQSLIDIHRGNEFPEMKLIGWVHDVGIATEPERFPAPDAIKPGSPWWYANTRFEDVHYFGVSNTVAEKLKNVPCVNSGNQISAANHEPISPGSDYESMQRNNRVVNALHNEIDWHETKQLWVTPGRIADRKNPLAAIEAVSLIEGAKLVIMGRPKIERVGNEEKINDPYYDLLKETVNQLGAHDKVIFLYELAGEISDKEYEEVLASLVQMADGVVTLPKEEGFGIDARNAALFTQTVVVSDDPALQANLGEAGHFVPRAAHAFHAAVTMAAANESASNNELRQDARSHQTWEGELRKLWPFLGISAHTDEKIPLAAPGDPYSAGL